jgi:hypothetical protein
MLIRVFKTHPKSFSRDYNQTALPFGKRFSIPHGKLIGKIVKIISTLKLFLIITKSRKHLISTSYKFVGFMA